MTDIAPTSTESLVTGSRPDAYSGLKTDEFIRIMFTELTNQDPFKPNDSAAILEQISSIRQIQSDIDMGAKLESLVTENQLAGASSLIGRLVSGISETHDRVIGLVVSVSRTDEGPVLNLDDGSRVPFGQVDELIDESLLEPGDGPEAPTPPGRTERDDRDDAGLEGNE